MAPERRNTDVAIATMQAEIAAIQNGRVSCQAAIAADLAEMKKQIGDLYKLMNQRLPLWATVLIGLMGSVIGWLAK